MHKLILFVATVALLAGCYDHGEYIDNEGNRIVSKERAAEYIQQCKDSGGEYQVWVYSENQLIGKINKVTCTYDITGQEDEEVQDDDGFGA